MTKTIRVAIVDDDAGLQQTIERCVALDPQFQCVRTCASGSEALAVLPEAAPDVVLMDINMRGMDGITCTQKLKSLLPETHIIMLTVFEDSAKIFDALAAGANGYLLKRMAPKKLLDSIREVMDGGAPMSPPIARKVVHHFKRSETERHERSRLAPRERDVLERLAKGLAYKQVADELGVSIGTVRTYVGRIYEKLHVHSCAEAVAKFTRA